MATEIKAIECPKCGSTQETEIRPKFFRCENCGTEYYLDTGDININVQQVPVLMATTPAVPAKPGVGVLGALMLMMLGMTLLSGIAHLINSFTDNSKAGSGVATNSRPAYNWQPTQSWLYLGPNGKPMLFQVGKRSYPTNAQDSVYTVFSDAFTGQALRSRPLLVDAQSAYFEFKQFTDGELFMLMNRTTMYQVSKAALTVEDVTKSLFAGVPELANGIASIESSSDDFGDGFGVVTNDGRSYGYFPRVNGLFKDGFFAAEDGFKHLKPSTTVHTGFAFTRLSTTYPDERPQLIKYSYRDNNGGPSNTPAFQWEYDYRNSDRFAKDDPRLKVLLTAQEQAASRVSSFEDFTPGRLYFGQHLLYSDEDYVLLAFQPTAAPASPVQVQCLNAQSGSIVFTLPLPQGGGTKQVVRYADGFMLFDGENTMALGFNGRTLTSPLAVP